MVLDGRYHGRMTTNSQTSSAGAFRPDDSMPIVAREGWPIVAIFVLVLGGIAAGAWFVATWAFGIAAFVAVVLIGWCIWFFRDPQRAIATDPNLVLSSADGVVTAVGPSELPKEMVGKVPAGSYTRISVFLNVFNVHVNRTPMNGKVVARVYTKGKFLNAALEKCHEENERCALAIETDFKQVVVVQQIAGLIARRIICRVNNGTVLRAGERFGLIRFGSRTDVYLPAGYTAKVRVGEKTVGGVTVLAERTAG